MENRICERCGQETFATSMSFFNTQQLCFACKEEERGAPNYAKAREAEMQACREGNFNFPGIGLEAEDAAYLEARRKNRARGSGLA